MIRRMAELLLHTSVTKTAAGPTPTSAGRIALGTVPGETVRCTRFYAGGRNRGAIKLIKNKITNTTANILAMLAAVPATAPKPSANAINAMIKNVTAQPNMLHLPFGPKG